VTATLPTRPADLLAAFHDALNAGPAIDRLDALLAPDFRHEAGGTVLDRDRYLWMQRAFAAGFSDFAVERTLTLTDGDWVAGHVRVRGTQTGDFLGHAATGRRFTAAGIDLFRVADGRLVEGRGVFDTVAMLRQLGLYREVEG
jgi:predicted ester cyclase